MFLHIFNTFLHNIFHIFPSNIGVEQLGILQNSTAYVLGVGEGVYLRIFNSGRGFENRRGEGSGLPLIPSYFSHIISTYDAISPSHPDVVLPLNKHVATAKTSYSQYNGVMLIFLLRQLTRNYELYNRHKILIRSQIAPHSDLRGGLL